VSGEENVKLQHEVVRVVNASQLIDAESYQRRLDEALVGSLEPGYYVAAWPTAVGGACNDRNARFIGPFVTRREAERADASLAETAMQD